MPNNVQSKNKKMKQGIITLLVVFLVFQNILAQSWNQYNIPLNAITSISITYTSSGSSAYTSGNSGILQNIYSTDTGRVFKPLDIINNPNALPYRAVVKIGNVSGVLIDPYHILTAGHVISFNSGMGTTKVTAGYDNGFEPYGAAYPVLVYLLSNYSSTSSTDLGIIKLDRPIGALVGCDGYGYNTNNSYYKSGYFFNPSYPFASPYNGMAMFNWKNIFDTVFTEFMYSFRSGYSGMSGSPAILPDGDNYVVSGVLVSSGIKFNRITASKFDAINTVLNLNTPDGFDMIPLYADAYPKKVKSGSELDSINLVVLNYSKESRTNQDAAINVYISSDSIITQSDDLIGTYIKRVNLNSKNSEIVKIQSGLPIINKPEGTYWLGAIISGDENTDNNTTGRYDASKIKVTSSDIYKVSGTITSTQNGTGIAGVNVSIGAETVQTDYKGYFETGVSAGYSGNLLISRTGYTFSQSTINISNLGSPLNYTLNGEKQIFTLSGRITGPISGSGISQVIMKGLIGEPYTNDSGYYSANVYYGYNVFFYPSKGSLNLSPVSKTYSNITSSKYDTFTGGYYLGGYVYDQYGTPEPDVLLQGLPGNVMTNSSGSYSVLVEEGWSGTVVPIKSGMGFSPSSRTYTNLAANYEWENYQKMPVVTLNLKLMLAGPYSEGSDTMTTSLNYRELLPLTPPDTVSGKSGTPFVYNRSADEILEPGFFTTHRDIVDWLVVEVRSTTTTKVDTVACLLRKDGKVISVTGSDYVPLRVGVNTGNYYIVVHHRNHIAIMSKNKVYLTTESELYDFTTGTDKYYGTSAHLLRSGLYGMFSADGDFSGEINNTDYAIYDCCVRDASSGYVRTDFNMDGYVTGSDFNLLAPNKKANIKTKIM